MIAAKSVYPARIRCNVQLYKGPVPDMAPRDMGLRSMVHSECPQVPV